MSASARLTWDTPPEYDDPQSPTREQIGLALSRRPGKWAIVAYADRATRAATAADRINTGREYGEGFEAVVRRVGNQHRTYARYVGE